jgi:hypothetical protein
MKMEFGSCSIRVVRKKKRLRRRRKKRKWIDRESRESKVKFPNSQANLCRASVKLTDCLRDSLTLQRHKKLNAVHDLISD